MAVLIFTQKSKRKELFKHKLHHEWSYRNSIDSAIYV